ncbi:MAG: TonB-dependent receptor domain-containing protein [Gemmatimonadales bacterium]
MARGRNLRRLALGSLTAFAGFVLPTVLTAQQQPGRITGRVVDAQQGTPLQGAVVETVGLASALRGATAVDGRFTLPAVPEGQLGLRIRMIGYGAKLVTGLWVVAGQTTTQDISLSPEAVQLDEVNVTADAERGSVAAALNEQRNAVGVVNAVTAEEIARSPDGDAAAAVQRVSGVTVQEGKYVFVRGLGERYTTTALNGSRIPSPEPERKVVPLDLFPSGLLQSITTSKTFTPDQPGDFSGAQVNIRTREYPAERQVTLATSVGWNSRATGSGVLRAPTTGMEWLAFGAGDRRLPSLVRDAGDFQQTPSQPDMNAMVNAFRNSWSVRRDAKVPNSSVSFSAGGHDNLLGLTVGSLFSGSYAYAAETQAEQVRAYAQPLTEPGQVREIDRFEGSTGRTSVLFGGLTTLSTTVGGSRFSVNASYNRTADNDARYEEGDSENLGGRFGITRLRYVERRVFSAQLRGEHQLGEQHRVDWTASRSAVARKEPDRSEIVYAFDTDPLGDPLPPVWFSASNEGAVRTFADLSEQSTEASAGYTLCLGSVTRPHQIRFGGLYRSTDRNADNRSYSISAFLPRSARELEPEAIFDGRFSGPNDTWFRVTPLSQGGSYDARDELAAGYAMVQLFLTDRLELVSGARVERSTVRVNTQPAIGSAVTARPEYTDVLPSLAFNYRLAETHTLRLSASQTLSRPEYRELAPVAYRDVIGGENVLGNPELKRALVQNVDLRWEWYPTPAEAMSVAVFAKRFEDPIERVYLATSGTRVVSFLNAESAENYGVELEARKNLGFLSPSLLPLSAHANGTLMHSRITIGGGGSSRINDERAMVGQAPYVVNGGLTWTGTSGASATVLYNVVGRRIVSASEFPLPDNYERPRHLVDVSARFPILGGLKGKVDLKNLLDSPFEIRQGSVVRERFRTGRIVSAGLSWEP